MIKKKQIKKKKTSAGKVIAIGAGLAALGAGAYYLLGPNGKANQKKAAAWMTKMKKEAQKKIGKIKNVSEPIYHNVLDTLAENYSKQYKQHVPEIKAFTKQLKSGWSEIKKEVKPIIKKAKKAVKKQK
jgi:gas vesicle protein